MPRSGIPVICSRATLSCDSSYYVFAAEVDSSITSTVEEKETAVESGDPSLPIAIERAVEQGIGKKCISFSEELMRWVFDDN